MAARHLWNVVYGLSSRLWFIVCAISVLAFDRRVFAQVEYASIDLSGAKYILNQQEPLVIAGYNGNFMHHGDVAALYYYTLELNEPGVILLHVDSWGRRLHEPVEVVNQGVMHVAAARFGGITCVFWRDRVGGTRRARLYSVMGEPMTVPFSVAGLDGISGGVIDWVTLNGTRIGFTASGQPDGASYSGLFLQVFDLWGLPLSDRLTIGTNGNARLGHPIMLSDNTVVVQYYRPVQSQDSIDMRRVEPDFSIGQPVTLLDPDVIRYARSVLADESFQYEVQRQVGEQVVNSLHRFDVYGNPLIDPIPIEPGFTSATAAPDGRFILAFGDQFYRYPPPVRLYDAQANPEREFFEYIINPPPIGSADFFSPLMAYQNDGAIYFGWNLSDATGFHQMLNTMHPYIPGDMNRDGLVNNFDIDSFVFALSNLPAYAAAYNIPEDAAVIIGDINEDGFLNNFDIDPFVMLLAGE